MRRGYKGLSKWTNDLNIDIDEVANNLSACNKMRETQFRHRLQITPYLRHKMDHNKSELCTKCNAEVWNFIHCVHTIYLYVYWRILE